MRPPLGSPRGSFSGVLGPRTQGNLSSRDHRTSNTRSSGSLRRSGYTSWIYLLLRQAILDPVRPFACKVRPRCRLPPPTWTGITPPVCPDLRKTMPLWSALVVSLLATHHGDRPLRRSFHVGGQAAASLVRAGLLVVWLQLSVSGFRPVLACGWHEARASRCELSAMRSAKVAQVAGSGSLVWNRSVSAWLLHFAVTTLCSRAGSRFGRQLVVWPTACIHHGAAT